MASNARRNSLVLTQKSGNTKSLSSDPKSKVKSMPKMSPEAQRVMGMVRDDVKENFTSSTFDTTGSSPALVLDNDLHSHMSGNIDDNNNNNDDASPSRNDVTGRTRTNVSGNRIQRLPPRQSSKVSSQASKGNTLNPARSRSTLSHTDPPFSISDNMTESCNQTTTASSASVYTNNNSASGNNNNNNNSNRNRMGGKAVANQIEYDDYDDADDENENDDMGTTYSVDQGSEPDDSLHHLPLREKSFVIAFNKALERKSISRLKGDITDTSGIHQAGTVRALDGGRLANAQEVVVNVCHDDDKQLVFHDDDEESLDTAKEISQIRVNIWMEYNSAFRPDNDINDFQIPEIPEDRLSSATAAAAVPSQKTSASGGALTARGIALGTKTSAGSRKSNGGSSGDGSGRAGVNNNNNNNTNKNNVRAGIGNKDKRNVNERSNINFQAGSMQRQRTSLVKLKSGQSNSSGSQRDTSSSKGAPINTRNRR